MAAERVLNLYLPAHLRADHAAGHRNILTAVIDALPGWTLIDRAESEGALPPHPGHALTWMQEPLGPRALCLRRAYFYPFWRIEPTNERWNYALVRATPGAAPPQRAQNLRARLAARILAGRQLRQGDFVYMPLQGRLLDHRSFQSMSPVAMIAATLAQWPGPVVATLHPGESYTPAEQAALAQIAAREPRFTLREMPAADLIADCAFVVTQNSSVALHAMIAGKGAVLFAGIDFHHHAGSVPRDGLAAAFDKGRVPPAGMADYLWWFLKQTAIDAQAPDAAAQVQAALRRNGWPV